MSSSRRDSHKAKVRRERIRQEKHSARSRPEPAPPPGDKTAEGIYDMLSGNGHKSGEELRAHLERLSAGPRQPDPDLRKRQNDPKWKAQDLAYQAEDTDNIEEARDLIRRALEFDPECLDARRLRILLSDDPPPAMIDALRELAASAEAAMGDVFVAENAGRFWQVASTRPYMRVRHDLNELLLQEQRWTEARESIERTIELNPTDNQGERNSLMAIYLAANDTESARALFRKYPNEEKHLAGFAWACVLERWLADGPAAAEPFLAQARRANASAEKYVSGRTALPEEKPEYFQPGDEDDAKVGSVELRIAWEAHPAFREWLRSRARAK